MMDMKTFGTRFRLRFCSRLVVFCSIFIAANTNTSCSHAQSNKMEDRLILGKEYAQTYLQNVLTGKEEHNMADGKRILIVDEKDAVKIAETVLFTIYPEKNIVGQRPYEIYNIDNHWVIMGTLPKEHLGGTFLIIMDARNAQILRISHGK